MSFFEFPHTRTYDSDLGWLIKEVQQVESAYQSLVDYMNTHQVEYEQLLARVNAIEGTIDTFEASVTAQFELLERTFDAKFNRLERELKQEIYVELQSALAQINTSIGQMRQELEEFRSEIKRLRIDMTSQDEATKALAFAYTDAKIEELINSLPDLTTVNVFNPVRGEITNIQIAIDDLYSLARRQGGLTALEYDLLGLSADDYDSLMLTALQYDQLGKYYLEVAGYYKNPLHYMTSPFTGLYVTVQTVVNELANLHKEADSLTAIEYDNKFLTASYYDGLSLTAFDYDWHGKTLVA